jgi:hypothetical protein
VPLIHGLFVLGQVFGSLLGVPSADVIGRKASILIFILAAGLSNMVILFLFSLFVHYKARIIKDRRIISIGIKTSNVFLYYKKGQKEKDYNIGIV